jgi:hypothetical protein
MGISNAVISKFPNYHWNDFLWLRYPFIASEIFELETNIVNIFFQEDSEENEKTETESESKIKKYSLLNYLFSIMDSKVELNDTLAGYYEKVLFSLYRKKTKEVNFS